MNKASTTGDWFLDLAPEALHPYIPRETWERLLLGSGLLGAGGLAYGALAPDPDKPDKIFPARHIRVARRKDREKNAAFGESKDPLGTEKWDPDWRERMGLGLIAPLGLAGTYYGISSYLENRGKKRLEKKLRRLMEMTDPAVALKEELGEDDDEEEEKKPPFWKRMIGKTASADEMLADLFLEAMAEKQIALEKQAGDGLPVGTDPTAMRSLWDTLTHYGPEVLGGAMGLGGLAGYIMARRALIPEAYREASPETRGMQLMLDRPEEDEEEDEDLGPLPMQEHLGYAAHAR